MMVQCDPESFHEIWDIESQKIAKSYKYNNESNFYFEIGVTLLTGRVLPKPVALT